MGLEYAEQPVPGIRKLARVRRMLRERGVQTRIAADEAVRKETDPLAVAAVGVELAGVVGVGLWTVLDPGLFADETVWSRFGAGYGFVPLVLPVVGLAWLLAHRPSRPTAEEMAR